MKDVARLGCICLLILVGSAVHVQADDTYWQHDPASQGDWFIPGNWSTGLLPGLADAAYIDNDGTALVGSGAIGISELQLGDSFTGGLIQSGGDVVIGSVGVAEGSQYGLTGGTLQINNDFDLDGTLDFGGGNAAVTIGDNAEINWSQGTLLNAGNTSISAGAGSVIYIHSSIAPSTFFGSFSSDGEVYQVSGSKLVIPSGFVMDETTVDRPDRMRVEGTLEGTIFRATQGGVEVAPGGLWDISNDPLYVNTDCAVYGGTLDIDEDMYIGSVSPGVTFTQTGGTVLTGTGLYNPGDIYIQNSSSYVLSGGELIVDGNLHVFNTGMFQQSDGVVTADQLKVSGGCRYELTGGQLHVLERFDLDGILDFDNGNAVVALGDDAIGEFTGGTILDAGNTTYTAGVQSESYFPTGFNPYTEFGSFSSQGLVHTQGTTLVVPVNYSGHVFRLNANSLEIAGTIILDPGGQITTSSFDLAGGTLMGDGTVIADTFRNDGTVSPGQSPGMLNIDAPYNQGAGGRFLVELGGLVAEDEYDVLIIQDIASLGGTLEVVFSDGFAPRLGNHFDIMLAESFVGSFDTTIFPAEYDFALSLVNSDSTLRLTTTATPEPAALSMLALGGLVLMRRQRRALDKKPRSDV